MFKGAKTPQGIINLVIEEIKAMPGGLHEAFAHDERIQLYSGPNYEYAKLLIGPDPNKYRNGDRAEKQAKEWGATRLDDTKIGKFLFVTNKLYEHLYGIYGDRDSVDEAAKTVMTAVSALFIRAAHGDVKTAVCGAERERVFYETEIEGLCDRKVYPSEGAFLVDRLLDNKDITSINGQPISVFRDLRKTEGLEAVYDCICKTELEERKSLAYKTGDKNVYEDYLDRLELYLVDGAQRSLKSTPAALRPIEYQELELPKAERLILKQKRIEEFEAATMASLGPSSPSVTKKAVKGPAPHP